MIRKYVLIISLIISAINYSSAQYFGLGDLEFNSNTITVGGSTDFSIEIEYPVSVIPAGSINIQISYPYNSYMAPAYNTPYGRDAHYFNWSLDENNFWNGVNIKQIDTDDKRIYIIQDVIGINPTSKRESTDVHFRIIRKINAYIPDEDNRYHKQDKAMVLDREEEIDLVSIFPSPYASDVAINESLDITLDQAIKIDNGFIEIRESDTNELFERIDYGSPKLNVLSNSLTIDASDFEYNQSYYVLINNSLIKSNTSASVFLGIHNPNIWTFTTTDFCTATPPKDITRCDDNLVLSTDIVLRNEVREEKALTTLAESDVSGNGHLHLEGSQNVRLMKGFTLQDGIKFTMNIEECEELTPSVNTKVYLEGALLASGGGRSYYLESMRTDLYNNGILPGMAPDLIFLNERSTLFSSTNNQRNPLINNKLQNTVIEREFATIPPGHPYRDAPWFLSDCTGSNFTNNLYNKDITDWIMVEVRSSISESSIVCQKAALLYSDGSVTFPDGGLCNLTPQEQVHIVIKHRNHLPIISPSIVVDDKGKVDFDFTVQDSYKIENSEVGQKNIAANKFVMIAGNIEQSNYHSSESRINESDQMLIINLIGQRYISAYNSADVDLNGSIDFYDLFLLNGNLNKSSMAIN